MTAADGGTKVILEGRGGCGASQEKPVPFVTQCTQCHSWKRFALDIAPSGVENLTRVEFSSGFSRRIFPATGYLDHGARSREGSGGQRGRRGSGSSPETDGFLATRIEALRRKDREAWEGVYRETVDAVYRHALYRLNGDRDAAEDVTQEVFIRAIEGIDSFRGDEGVLTGWLRGIGRRVLARRARDRRPEAARTISLDAPREAVGVRDSGGSGRASSWLDPPDPHPPVTEQIADREQQIRIGAALTALPPRWESVLRWKYLDGLRVDVIAERLGLSPKAAESLLTRARTAFRTVYLQFLDHENGRIHEVEEWPENE